MKKYRVGFDRQIKLEWFDKAVEVYLENKSIEDFKKKMSTYISNFDIKGDAIRKTIGVLKRVWINVPKEHEKLRDEAIDLFLDCKKEDRIWIHWGMCLLAYPFFKWITDIIGNFRETQKKVSKKQIEQKFIEQKGKRSTAMRALNRVIKSLIWWKVLKKTNIYRTFAFPPKLSSNDKNVKIWFCHALILSNNSKTILKEELKNLNYVFPFNVDIEFYELKKSENLSFYNEGFNIEYISYRHK